MQVTIRRAGESMKKRRYAPQKAWGVTAFLVIAASMLFLFALQQFDHIAHFFDLLFQILRPIMFGLVLAFLLLPLHRRIHKLLSKVGGGILCRSKRGKGAVEMVSILLSLSVLFLLIYLLLAMVIPQVYLSIMGLVSSMPGYFSSIHSWLQEYLKSNPEVRDWLLPAFDSAAASVQNWLQSDLMPNLQDAKSVFAWLQTQFWPSFSSVASGVSSALLAIVYFIKDILLSVIISIYLLLRKDILAAQLKKILYSVLRTRHADLIVEESRNAYRILSGFLIGEIIDACIVGVLCLIGCNIFGFPYPVLIATVIGITNVIPFFGPFIGAVPCGLLILLADPLQALYFALFILVLQQIDGNILHPKILGDSTGLDAFWVLFSILLFGGLFGFVGMLLGVPVFAMIYSITRRLVRNALDRRGLPVATREYMGKTEAMAGRSTDPDDDWGDK